MKINHSISPLSNVLALINGKNGSAIDEAQVTIDSIVASDENPGDNTKITLTGIDGQGIEGSRSFFYGRLDLTTQIVPLPTSVFILETDTDAQIKTKVSSAFGLIESNIVVSAIARPTAGTPGSCTIAPTLESLIYADVDRQVVLEVA